MRAKQGDYSVMEQRIPLPIGILLVVGIVVGGIFVASWAMRNSANQETTVPAAASSYEPQPEESD
jgi:hypothetical protein